MNVLVIRSTRCGSTSSRRCTTAKTSPPRAAARRVGVLHPRIRTPASGTDISLGTLLTGRFGRSRSDDVPEAIRGLGRYTSSAMPSEVLRHVGEVMLGRGFDRVRKVHTDWEQQDIGDHVSSGVTTDETLKAIAAAKDQPFFVWAHYFDVHEHHQIDVPGDLRRAVHDGGSSNTHRYRAMVFAVDRALGRLLDELDRRGLRDRTIIMFASDHGESLKEDPRLLDTHGRVAYGPLVRIPIAFRVPGVKPARRLDPISLVDLAPTLLDLLGGRDRWAASTAGLVPALSTVPRRCDPHQSCTGDPRRAAVGIVSGRTSCSSNRRMILSGSTTSRPIRWCATISRRACRTSRAGCWQFARRPRKSIAGRTSLARTASNCRSAVRP
jgi:hypothetical protein